MDIETRLLRSCRIDPVTECWIWTGCQFSRGYGAISVNGKQCRAHRVAYETWVGPIPNGLCVCHSCDTPLCINPAHLWVGTHRDNAQDKMRKGRANFVTGDAHGMRKHPERRALGERHGSAKLTLKDRNVILVLLQEGVQGKDIAQRFGVSRASVSRIKHKKAWSGPY